MFTVEQEKEEKTLTAFEIQRRLELKDFFLAKSDKISAMLVDKMFDLASFEELKAQVQRLHGDIPNNWKTVDRYEKYKEMLKAGASSAKVQREMEKDGLDPSEFSYDDEYAAKAKNRLSKCRTDKEKSQLLGQLQREKSKKNARLGRWTRMIPDNKNKKTRKNSKEKPRELDWDDFETQKELHHIQKVSSTSQSLDKSDGKISMAPPRNKMRLFRKKAKKNRTKRSDVPISHRKRLESLASSAAEEEKKKTLKDSSGNLNLNNVAPLSDAEDEDSDTDIKINRLHRSQFLYNSTDVEKEPLGGNTRRSKYGMSPEEQEIAQLAKKNHVVQIHDFQPFFANSKDSLRKASVAKLAKKVSRAVTRSRASSLNSQASRDSLAKERIVFPTALQESEYSVEDEDEGPKPPVPPRRRGRRPRDVRPKGNSETSEFDLPPGFDFLL